MRRKALLIGNTGGLNGVQLDIAKAGAFLRSPSGGAWISSEIEVLENPRKSDLTARIDLLRQQAFDFAFVLFSGHGGHARETIIELNPSGELLAESSLHNIATRQVSIIDCCRAMVSEAVQKSTMTESLVASTRDAVNVRKRYDDRMMAAIPQQARLYACAVGEAANDLPTGAVYLGHLLESSRSFDVGITYKTAEAAHAEARTKTLQDRRISDQTPEAVFAKCLTAQKLILSIRP